VHPRDSGENRILRGIIGHKHLVGKEAGGFTGEGVEKNVKARNKRWEEKGKTLAPGKGTKGEKIVIRESRTSGERSGRTLATEDRSKAEGPVQSNSIRKILGGDAILRGGQRPFGKACR